MKTLSVIILTTLLGGCAQPAPLYRVNNDTVSSAEAFAIGREIHNKQLQSGIDEFKVNSLAHKKMCKSYPKRWECNFRNYEIIDIRIVNHVTVINEVKDAK